MGYYVLHLVPIVLLPLFGAAFVAREVRAYRREKSPAQARESMIRYAPSAARRHGSDRPVPPEPPGGAR